MNWYANISVYKSAKDNVGQVMSLTDFMRLGHQMKDDIEKYRMMKSVLSRIRERSSGLQSMLEGLQEFIEENRNPLGGEELDPKVIEAVKERKNIENEIGELKDKIAAQSRMCDEQKRHFPCATISGWFAPTRAKANLQQHSGFICIDIDDHYNLNGNTYTQSLAGIRDLLVSLPWVMYAAHSVGGAGYFALIPLGPVDDDHPHEWYFDCLKAEFEQMGIVIDPACRDTTRLRFLSYDDNPVRNAQCEHYMGSASFVSKRERQEREQEEKRRAAIEAFKAQRNSLGSQRSQLISAELCVTKIEERAIDITGSYDQCIKLGRAFYSLGDEGLYLWKRVCMLRSASHAQLRTPEELDYKWKTFSKTASIDIGYFFNVCKEHNIYAKSNN